jgi:predicted metal-dependent phosphotriesterase family hydrolase
MGVPPEADAGTLSTKILPVLREHGVTDAQIDELTIDNPWRFLDPARVVV